MRNKIFIIMAAVAMTLSMNSCRETSDNFISYGQMDYLNFEAAGNSFAGQFKAIWMALNSNYGIWDYEAEHGLDWDAVYDTCLPKMEELDKRDDETNPVTDDELKKLYEQILGPLHDGHFYMTIQNLHTGNFLQIYPSELRNADRPDINIQTVPSWDYYLTDQAGENKIADYSGTSVRPGSLIKVQIASALETINQKVVELEAIDNRTDLQDYFLQKYLEAQQDFSSYKLASMEDIAYYNNVLATKYADLGITLTPWDIDDTTLWIDAKYACFKDGIAYFGFTGFALTAYLEGKIGDSPCADYYEKGVQEAWSRWFQKVQDLHNAGQLKGVVIDVRNNVGGNTADYQYVLGALLPSGGHQVASARFKTGVGRYDYSPVTPQVLKTFSGEHAVITEPIVVMANCHSVSMAEVTCLGAKQVDNARVLGMRTHGGMCLLMNDPAAYSVYYSSSVGIKNQTPFYAYIPVDVTITNQGGILEGVGVTPDIEVQLDQQLLQATGRDSQLERALQYIRTGN